jgi:hypothetical protein
VLLSRALASCGTAGALGPRRSDGSARAFADADAGAEPSLVRPGGAEEGPENALEGNTAKRTTSVNLHAAVDSTRDINSLWIKTRTLWKMRCSGS